MLAQDIEDVFCHRSHVPEAKEVCELLLKGNRLEQLFNGFFAKAR